jgi:hypothetical protein
VCSSLATDAKVAQPLMPFNTSVTSIIDCGGSLDDSQQEIIVVARPLVPFNTLVTSIIDRGGSLDNLRREIIVKNVCLVF